VVVQLKDEPLFAGKLKDVSAPYIGLATALSLGVGIVNFSVVGWKWSSKKSNKVVEQLSDLQQQLREKEALLEEVLVSEARLQAAGLDAFLDEPEMEHQTASAVVAQPQIVQHHISADVQVQPVAHQRNTQPVNPSLRLAQTLSELHTGVSTNGLNGAATLKTEVASNPAVSQVQQLQDQLKRMVEQVEQLQGSLETATQPTPEPLTQPELTNMLLHQLNHRLNKLESKWSPQEMVS
jgi:uncharacterized coiled-coil protein SlyX